MGIVERKEREKEQRKEEILDAAQKVFFEKGLATATMDEIAETAELSKGTLYLYYKSKEDLFIGVMMRGMEGLHTEFERIGSSNFSSVEKMVKLHAAYVKHFYKERKFFQMTNYLQSPHFHKQVSNEMKQSCDAEGQKVWKTINNILEDGVKEGVLRSDFNYIELGIILWSNTTSLLFRIDSEGDMWKKRFNIDLEHTLEISNRILFESILTDRGHTEYIALTQR